VSVTTQGQLAEEVADRMREHGYTRPLNIRYRRVTDMGYIRVSIVPKGGEPWSSTALQALTEIITAAFSHDHRWSIITEVDPWRMTFRWYRPDPEGKP
jgi:hypothetical protein